MIKPKKLEEGDRIAFVAPASGLAALVPHRLEIAKSYFEKRGYKVKIYPTVLKNKGFSSDLPKKRAKDINNAFSDPEVKMILCTIGGNSSHQILEYLNFDLIRKNPKIFCGYSDITSLHFAFHTQSNLITFYGPTAIAEFGEKINFERYTGEYFFKAVGSNSPIGRIFPSKKWTDCKKANWLKKEDLKLKRKYHKNTGYEWLRKGKAKGKIIGGCITSIMHTKGTKYWPDFSNKILFLETPEGESFFKGESLANIDGYLADLRLLGIFKQIKGLIVGRGFGYTKEEREVLKKLILFNTRDFDFPILYGADIGHTDPKITIPLGVNVSLNSEKNLFSIDESGVE